MVVVAPAIIDVRMMKEPGPVHGSGCMDGRWIAMAFKGSGVLETAQGRHILTRGDWVVLDGQDAWEIHQTHNLELLLVAVDPALLEAGRADLADTPGYRSFYPETGQRPATAQVCHACLEAQELIAPVVGAILEECRLQASGWRLMVQAKVLELVLMLTRSAGFRTRAIDPSAQQLAKALSFMEANLHRRISLAEIAAQACMSERHFLRLFGSSQGLSPYRYLLQLRIKKSCQLIRQGRWGLVDIAQRCGFEDPNHFSRQFHQIMGCSPTAYRSSLEM